MDQRCAVILAAGEGKRMKTGGAKALCQVLFRPMLAWVLENCSGAGIETKEICVVVGKSSQEVCEMLPGGSRLRCRPRDWGPAMR